MQPVRTKMHRQPRATTRSWSGRCDAIVIVVASSARAAHIRTLPRGGGAAATAFTGGGPASISFSSAAVGGGSSRRAATIMYAAPAAALISPTLEMSNMFITNDGSWLRAAPAATMLVDEPMRESVPPSIVANESGMSSEGAGTLSERAQSRTIGIIIAHTGVLFMKAEITIVGTSIRSSAAPYPDGRPSRSFAMSSRPPVHCTPFATAHITPTETTPSDLKPFSASFSVITPVATSTTTVSRSTWSGETSKAICTSATMTATAVIAADFGSFGSAGATSASAPPVASSIFCVLPSISGADVGFSATRCGCDAKFVRSCGRTWAAGRSAATTATAKRRTRASMLPTSEINSGFTSLLAFFQVQQGCDARAVGGRSPPHRRALAHCAMPPAALHPVHGRDCQTDGGTTKIGCAASCHRSSCLSCRCASCDFCTHLPAAPPPPGLPPRLPPPLPPNPPTPLLPH